jgi:uncharacterized protein
MHLKRHAFKTAKDLLTQYKVLTIVGPRQSGKSTLAQKLRPDLPYINLEDLRHREFALNDPVKFTEKYANGAIFDEVQRAPSISSQIQVAVDKSSDKGKFILTGSHQFEVMERISQSLAGRTSILRLLPFSFMEAKEPLKNLDTDSNLFRGFYPQVVAEGLNPVNFYQDYVSTYLERDLRQLIEIKNLSSFQRFLKIAAGRVGQILDLGDLGDAVGVSQTTAKTWMTILEASFIVFLLQPYHANIKKRLVKRPKLYFFDVGLVSFLIDLSSSSQIATHPLRGSLFENMIVSEIVKSRFHQHLPTATYFYRDKDKNEVDILTTSGHVVTPIEVKSGKTISSDYFKGIRSIAKTSITLSNDATVVYDGSESQQRSDANVVGWREFCKNLYQRNGR